MQAYVCLSVVLYAPPPPLICRIKTKFILVILQIYRHLYLTVRKICYRVAHYLYDITQAWRVQTIYISLYTAIIIYLIHCYPDYLFTKVLIIFQECTVWGPRRCFFFSKCWLFFKNPLFAWSTDLVTNCLHWIAGLWHLSGIWKFAFNY